MSAELDWFINEYRVSRTKARQYVRVMNLQDTYTMRGYKAATAFFKRMRLNTVKELRRTYKSLDQTDAESAILTVTPFFLDYAYVDEMMSKIFRDAWDKAAEQAARELTVEYIREMGLKDLEALQVIEVNGLGAIKGLSGQLLLDVEYTIRNGISNGKTMNEVVQDILKLPKWEEAEWKAMRIVRTETTRAVNQGRIMQFEKHGIKRVRWMRGSAIDFGCVCPDEEGNEYDINEAWGMIPAHPNCQCFWEAVDNGL